MMLEDIKVSERELLDNLPLFGVQHLSKEKLKSFVDSMREHIRKRKFEDLQKNEFDV